MPGEDPRNLGFRGAEVDNLIFFLICFMATARVYYPNGGHGEITCRTVTCPRCGTKMVPQYLSADEDILFCRCSDADCNSPFLLKRGGPEDAVLPNHGLLSESFSNIIRDVSADFVRIYNEAFSAEQMGLMEICGVGYRKALEFLIKDYVSRDLDEENKERVGLMALAKCIEKYVDNVNVKKVAERAVWIGNDEAHYVRKWEEKDVQDLKGLIQSTIWWIEQSVKTEELLRDMPEGR